MTTHIAVIHRSTAVDPSFAEFATAAGRTGWLHSVEVADHSRYLGVASLRGGMPICLPGVLLRHRVPHSTAPLISSFWCRPSMWYVVCPYL